MVAWPGFKTKSYREEDYGSRLAFVQDWKQEEERRNKGNDSNLAVGTNCVNLP